MIKVLQKKFVLVAMLAVTILLVVLLGVINIANFVSSTQDINEALDEIVASSQMGLSSSSQGPFGEIGGGYNPDNDYSHDGDESFQAEDGTAYFSVTLDEDGNALMLSMSGITSLSSEEAISMAEDVFDTKSISGYTGDYKYTAYTSLNSSGITYVFLDTEFFRSGVLRVVVLSFLVGLACWGLMFLLVFFLSKRFIKPIAENIDRQKVFVSDAGHEIKTPIAIIQANTEAMELYNGENKWSRNIKEQTKRLTSLVSNLLTLSKASETYEKPVFYDVDLAGVIEDNVEQFKEPAALKGKVIDFDNRGPAMVKGDKEQFARIVSLLLDNAVKYAPEMSEIKIEILMGSKTVTLKMTNDCDSLPDCEPSRLFDRFYRPDSSRSSSTGGTGIGLATVKAIAEQYEAKAECVYGDKSISFLVGFKKA